MEKPKSESARKSFYCPYDGCAKQSHAYSRRENLRDHIRSQHTGLRFACADCSKPFIRLGDLKKHSLTVHKREKKFVCDPASSVCGCERRFPTQYNLNRHQSRFEGDRTLLARDISDANSDPVLRDAFADMLKLYVEKLQMPVLGDNQDEVLTLCAAEDTISNDYDISHGTRQSDANSPAPGTDAIDTALYQRLVRLFRSPRPRTLRMLLEDVGAVVRDANIARITRLIDPRSLLEGIYEYKLWATSVASTFRGATRLSSCLRFRVQGNDMLLTLDHSDVEPLSGWLDMDDTGPFSLPDQISRWKAGRLQSEIVVRSLYGSEILRWAADRLVVQAQRSVRPTPVETLLENRRGKAGRAAGTFHDAHYAASCLKSVSAGHTDSVDEMFCPSQDKVPHSSLQRQNVQHRPPRGQGSSDMVSGAALYMLAGLDSDFLSPLGPDPLPDNLLEPWTEVDPDDADEYHVVSDERAWSGIGAWSNKDPVL